MVKYLNVLNSQDRIERTALVSDIVSKDYRTALVFRKYNIDFCCGGKWPLEIACDSKGLDVDIVINEITDITRSVFVPSNLQFANWETDFLIDYIINIHHQYLKRSMPEIKEQLVGFKEKHITSFPELQQIEHLYNGFMQEMIPHLIHEEEIIFPYIRQLAHAHRDKEPYGALLIRTLGKPIEAVMNNEHESTGQMLRSMRKLTNNYSIPAGSCANHQVTFSFLKELDNDLVQHTHLENNILFPRAIAMEKELLQL